MARYVTGVMMRAESSILGLVEIVGGVAIAAAVREIAVQVAICTLDRSWPPAASCTRHVLENEAGSQAAMTCEA